METLFVKTLSTDTPLRKSAVNELARLQKVNYSCYAADLFDLLSLKTTKDHLRLAAGIALKNSLSSAVWSLSDEKTKKTMKTNILSLLDTKKRNVANVVSQVIAAIAVIELPSGHWQELIETLVANVTNHHASCDLKQSTLQTIGYICESLDPTTLSVNQCNAILTAIIEGARREQINPDVRIAAIKALYNSLEFTQKNFATPRERDYIMKVVCDGATLHNNPSVDLQVTSYECLNRIMQLYYDTMDNYMSSSLFNLTVFGLIRSDPRVTLQAIEFWCTVSEIEIGLKEQVGKSKMYSFCDQSVAFILPSLFRLLIKKKSDDDDEWNIPNAASHCLSLLAQCCQELVLPQTIEFITQNLFTDNSAWNEREASIIAFGCIIKGPCKYKTEILVNQILPTILSSMKESNSDLIRKAASWTLSRIIKESVQVLDVDTVLRDIVPIVIKGLYDTEQKIVYNSCLCCIYLSEELKIPASNKAIATSGPLSKYTRYIMAALLGITQKSETSYDTKCRNTIYEAMSSIITHCAQDCEESLTALTEGILNRLEKLITLAETNGYNYDDFWTLHTSLLGVLTSCVYRLSEASDLYADQIMTLVSDITRVYLHTNITLVEDAFLLVSGLINSTGKRFARNVDRFLPKLLRKSVQSDRLAMISVGIMSDLSCTFGEDIFPYAKGFMTFLLNNLKSETLDKQVKPVTLSCIGDIAQALGPMFIPFVDIVMMALKQAGNMQSDKKDTSMVQYVDAIRVGTLEAFVGVIQGLESLPSKDFLLPHVVDITLFLNNVAMDEAKSDRLTKTLFGVLGDIARIYGKNVKPSLLESPLNHMVIENSKGQLYFSKGTREMAHWAQQTVISVYYK